MQTRNKGIDFEDYEIEKNGLSEQFKARILKMTIGEGSKKLVTEFMESKPDRKIREVVVFCTELWGITPESELKALSAYGL